MTFNLPKHLPAVAGFFFLLLIPSSATMADEITVKGQVLTGKILALTKTGVVFETDYGKGSITVPYGSVDAIESETAITVLYGEDGKSTGRVLGVDQGEILLGSSPDAATRIEIGEIFETQAGPGDGWYNRLQSRYRFWTGSFNFGVSYSDETTDETDVTVGLDLERKKSPTRVVVAVRYIFGKDNPAGEESRKSDNELTALLKGEYEFNPRVFGYLSNDFENDELEQLSLRWVAKGGLGYKFIQTENTTLQGEVGPAYVYRNFHGGGEEDYPAISFGGEAQAKLFESHLFKARADYLPSLGEWEDDYVIRGSASYTVPISSYLSAKWSFVNVYDNTPDDGTERNELKVLFALSFVF